MSSYVLDLREIDKTKLYMVGGKGANLGELYSIEGIPVPEGFCVTTEAYKKMTENNDELNSLLDKLTHIKAEDREISVKLPAKFVWQSKERLFLRIYQKKYQIFFSSLEKTMGMQCAPVQLRRICRQPHLQASTTLI